MERQRQELGLRNTNSKAGILFDKMNNNKKGQSLIHKTDNLLDVVLDNFDCPLFVARGLPNYPNIRLAGNSPTGYSAGTILLLIKQKIRHYGQNESCLTQWHTKVFQNIKLASLYSKSVSRENSKYVDFASVQVKHIL